MGREALPKERRLADKYPLPQETPKLGRRGTATTSYGEITPRGTRPNAELLEKLRDPKLAGLFAKKLKEHLDNPNDHAAARKFLEGGAKALKKTRD